MLYIIAHLYTNPDAADAFHLYEEKALVLFKKHGGTVIGAFKPERPGTGSTGRGQAYQGTAPDSWDAEVPHEIHMPSIPTDEAFANYRNDPGILALAEERTRVIRKTDIFVSRETVQY